MSFDDLPPLRESLAAAGLAARKSFGQHFLLDLNITRKIARLAGPLDGEAVIEVGPGPGGLDTRPAGEAGAHVRWRSRPTRASCQCWRLWPPGPLGARRSATPTP